MNICTDLAKTATVALLIGFAALPAHAESLTPTTVAIPAVSFAFTADYVAEDAHLYEQSGLDVKIQFLAGNAGFNALIGGAVDFSFSSGRKRATTRRQPRKRRAGSPD